jgi:agmatine deiminase
LTSSQTPFSTGYRMPAEWEDHQGTWLSWPKNPETFTDEHLPAVRKTFARIITELCAGERVHLLVDDIRSKKEVIAMAGENRNLAFHLIPSADVWMRDYGPIFVRNSDVAATKWVFNAWGSKYDDLLPDNETGRSVLKESGVRGFEVNMVLEGGSIDVNGRGFLLTTRQCLLNKNRNPALTQVEIEAALRDNLGATNIIWLEEGIEGDDTDGHIDDIARFVAHDTVVCMTEQRGTGGNSESLATDLELLRQASDPEGHKLRIVEIPMPSPVSSGNDLLPASYANFYIGNSVVLVPTFNDPNDGTALRAIDKLFPSRRVVGVDCRGLVTGLGTIHCVTQQQPAGL